VTDHGRAQELVTVCVVAAVPDVAAFRAQRVLLWQRRDNIVQPFGETVQQVFARISALRDSLDGPQVATSFP
jgi:hypothetical protein